MEPLLSSDEIASLPSLLPYATELELKEVECFAAAEAGNLEGLVVSMPPQHGKSMLCSHYLNE
jgi:hypothetical protein